MTKKQALKRANEVIDELSGPEAMSLQAALDFYEELAGDIEAKIEGVRADLRRSGG